MRLDQRLTQEFKLPSRSAAQNLIKNGRVKVNGKIIDKTSVDVIAQDHIAADLSELNKSPVGLDIPIIHEDSDCLVIDKPLGVLTHSKGSFNPESTVATWLASHEGADNLSSTNREGIVHRLDRATSGVMICAKTPGALSWLQKQFSTRKTKKTYAALVENEIQPKEAVIDMPIERNPKKPSTFRVGANGKQATTKYSTESYIEVGDKLLTLVKLSPVTGRTHQLRVHLSNLGYPIVGDELYGGLSAQRLYLHALSLELTLPNKTRMTFNAQMPKDFLSPKLK
jgi:23S rRNA pseudouridine1911/1915/1917 synthase